LNEQSVQLAFEMPVDPRYVGPSSTGAGVATVSESGVRLRFDYQTGFESGNTDGGPWHTGLDVYEIRSVKLKSGLLGTRLVIQTQDASRTEEIPGAHNGTVILRVPSGQKEAAKQSESVLTRGLALK
jgi:hypothetical protein